MSSSEAQAIRQDKLKRLSGGEKPRVLEICSGCGGLSLGLLTAGFELSAHIEIEERAAESYALNFGAGKPKDDPWAIARDMVKCSAQDIVTELKLETTAANSFDVLAAGLPCQAFARIGRSKLRARAGGQEDAFQKDPRATLYKRFLQYVEDTQPLVILIENVPDILNFGGHNVPEEICDSLENLGYQAGYTILNAAYFGVPQVRERLFIVALARELEAKPEFPEPERFLSLPKGYESSRRVALKYVDTQSDRFRPIQQPSAELPAAVSAKSALADLPIIKEHVTSPKTMRRRKLVDELPYQNPIECTSPYGRLMRTWPAFETTYGASAHLVRLTPRDFPTFAAMRHGDDYPKALKIAEDFFNAAVQEKRLAENDTQADVYLKLRAKIVPPYDPGKFPNKWWKLNPELPSRTLTAHMGKDTYSHIHYDSDQCRTVSVREAARLQSFPDGFRFAGEMNVAFRQIGNAVPPLLGLAVAKVIKRQLEEAAAGAGVQTEQEAA